MGHSWEGQSGVTFVTTLMVFKVGLHEYRQIL